jgi:hypothetical protein
MNKADCVIAVQTFNKFDTALETLDSIANCRDANNFGLIIVQDGLEGNRLMGKYIKEHEVTKTAVSEWINQNQQKFRFLNFYPETQGRGTAGTARFLVDKAFEAAENVIFSEDDVIFEPDALDWFLRMLCHDGFLRDDVWGIAGESKYFDLKGEIATDEQRRAAYSFASKRNLLDKFSYMHLLPSSCFATNRIKWAEFGHTRGEGHGPRKVVERCQNEGKQVIWPIIARCADIGMHHEIGYSMTLKKSKEKIPGKSSYITSGIFGTTDLQFKEISLDDQRASQAFFGLRP